METEPVAKHLLVTLPPSRVPLPAARGAVGGAGVHIWTFYQKYMVRTVHIWTFYQKICAVRSIYDLLRGNRVEDFENSYF